MFAGCISDQEDEPEPERNGESTSIDDSTDQREGNNTPSEQGQEESTPPQEEEESTPDQVDAVLSYEVTDGSSWDSELPDTISPWMEWIVLSFNVEEGSVSMEDLWFRSRVDTGERYKPASARSDDALENGITNRGDILEGGSADILYKVPSYSDTYEWNLSGLQRQSVDGENIQLEEPGDISYGDVTVSSDIEITNNSDIIPDDAEQFKDDSEEWGIVELTVREGLLNVEDVWFRSKLRVGNRQAEIDYATNRYVKRGMRTRGEIKEGYTGYAIYIVPEGSDNPTWITDEMEQSVTIE
jgi:hypothetical protein